MREKKAITQNEFHNREIRYHRSDSAAVRDLLQSVAYQRCDAPLPLFPRPSDGGSATRGDSCMWLGTQSLNERGTNNAFDMDAGTEQKIS